MKRTDAYTKYVKVCQDNRRMIARITQLFDARQEGLVSNGTPIHWGHVGDMNELKKRLADVVELLEPKE